MGVLTSHTKITEQSLHMFKTCVTSVGFDSMRLLFNLMTCLDPEHLMDSTPRWRIITQCRRDLCVRRGVFFLGNRQ